MSFQGFLTETTLQLAIEKIVTEDGVNYMQAMISFCEENDIDYSDVSKLLTKNLKDKIRMSAMEEGYFKQESTLPL